MTSRAPEPPRDGHGGIEPMRWWDIASVADLERRLFPAEGPWSPAMFWSELAAGHYYRVWRANDSAVLGYAGLARGPDVADVHTIAVAPGARGRGIGRALLGDLLDAAGVRAVMLEVRCDNEAAIALYASEGFTRVGVRRRYYQPSGADAYTMARPAGGGQ
jgi:ribosomal-protein-alanine N-acetyltransferase